MRARTARVELPLDVAVQVGDTIPVVRHSRNTGRHWMSDYRYDESASRSFMSGETLHDAVINLAVGE